MNETYVTVETEHLRARIHEQIRSGQLDAAQASLKSLVKLSPQSISVCLKLSDILARQGRWNDSCGPLLLAAQHLPRHVPMVLQLIQQLIAHGEVVAARQCLDFLDQAPNPPVDLLRSQAGLRSMLKEYALANGLLERATREGANDPDSHYMHAMLLHFTGDMTQACCVLERCIRRWPSYVDAALLLVNLRKQTQEVNLLSHADEQLDRFTKGDQDRGRKFARAKLEYIRFKALDDLDRREEAWPALASFNKHMHELCPYDAEGESAVVDALVRFSAVDDIAGHGEPALDGPVPIFIVGMPRSGTTLLERMLSAHSQVGSAGEIIDFRRQLRMMTNVRYDHPRGLLQAIECSDRIDFRELGARYLRQTQWHARGRAFYIDKLPSNIQMVSFIRRALPRAPILHMVRNPMDTCFSNFKSMFGNASSYSYSMGTLAHYYRQYTRIATHWHHCLPEAMLDVPYTELVSDTEDVVRRVLAHCGLAMEAACLHPERNTLPVATRSSAQVREPVHQRGMSSWRRYETHLQPLKKALVSLAVS